MLLKHFSRREKHTTFVAIGPLRVISVEIFRISMVIYISDLEVLHGHRDYNQVVLDVNRSLKRFPPGNLSAMKKIASEMSSAEVVCCK